MPEHFRDSAAASPDNPASQGSSTLNAASPNGGDAITQKKRRPRHRPRKDNQQTAGLSTEASEGRDVVDGASVGQGHGEGQSQRSKSTPRNRRGRGCCEGEDDGRPGTSNGSHHHAASGIHVGIGCTTCARREARRCPTTQCWSFPRWRPSKADQCQVDRNRFTRIEGKSRR